MSFVWFSANTTSPRLSIKFAKKKTIVLDLRYCDKHPAHNRFMYDLWKASSMKEVRTEKSLLLPL